MIDNYNPNKLCSADAIGKIVCSEFINLPNYLETVKFVFHITDVVRQKDEQSNYIYL